MATKHLLSRHRRTVAWIRAQRRRGVPLFVLAVYHLPIRLLLKLYHAVCASMNSSLPIKTVNARRFAVFHNRSCRRLEDPFYIVVLPYTLPYLIPCLKCLPESLDIVLVLNGTRGWEEEYIKENLDVLFFRLWVLPHSSMPHGHVLNILLDGNRGNFGIIDHDLFVFDESVFEDLVFKDDEFVIGAYRVENKKAQLSFPRTHFLFFNTGKIREVMERYDIGAQEYRRIPSELVEKLASLNLGKHNYLKPYLTYFDTLNLIMAMAFYDGLSARIRTVTSEKMLHIGGTSRRNYLNKAQLAYADIRFVEQFGGHLLREKYGALFPDINDLQQAADLLLASESSLRFASTIDVALERIARTIAESIS